MKATPLLVAWHNDSAPIYSTHFEPKGKGRLATAGGDNNVRLWQIEQTADDRKVTYLATLVKHTQAVNVVRWSPAGDTLASAGDDGNVLIWAQSDLPIHRNFAHDDGLEDKETWIVKKMCRSPTSREIYDLAWSPNGNYFITGSMDNVACIYDATTGSLIRQIAEHSHYVQGVAWDPLNEYIATQSSDRSVHIYALRTHDGQFSLSQHGRISRMDLPPRRRRTSNSPVPPDFGARGRPNRQSIDISQASASPAPSAPGTPASLALPMNPPPPGSVHSRRSSIGNSSPAPSMRRSASPAAMPLPAVMPSASPNPYVGIAVRNTNIYANETLTSFFRRLTFAPDGSLLFTPAGQYKTSQPSATDKSKTTDDVINTVYIYGRAGLNKPPIAHLPGHKKPSIAVRCSPVYYNLRLPAQTKNITLDTSAGSEDMTPLPDPVQSMPPPSNPPTPAPSNRDASPSKDSADGKDKDNAEIRPPPGPPSTFALPYRMVYAVATQDAVYVYDTQQQTPLCVVSNLHYSTFTDLSWSTDGLTLIMSSSDGFCSALSFAPNELGTTYTGSLASRTPKPPNVNTSGSAQSSPAPTPTAATVPPMVRQGSSQGIVPSPSPLGMGRPPSPTRTNSASSIATQSSFAVNSFPTAPTPGSIINDPVPSFGHVPSLSATQSSITGSLPTMASPTPPMTPAAHGVTPVTGTTNSHAVPAKRESESEGHREDKQRPKKRRIAPTPVGPSDPPVASQETSKQDSK